jgi:alkyl hydroperoxide reductase subunit AhpC
MAWHDASSTIRKIQFPMVGDPTLTIGRNFGVLIEDEGMADRGTLVIDPDGRIRTIRNAIMSRAQTPRSHVRDSARRRRYAQMRR